MVFSSSFEYPSFCWCLRLRIFLLAFCVWLLLEDCITLRATIVTANFQHSCPINVPVSICDFFDKRTATTKPVLNPDKGFVQYCCTTYSHGTTRAEAPAYSRANSIWSPASSASNVSEPWLMSQIK